MSNSSNSFGSALPRLLVNDRASTGRPYADCAIFLLLPTLLNLSSVAELHVSRILISAFFAGMLLKNTFLYSAISQNWQHQVSHAFGEVFNIGNKTLMVLLILIFMFTISEIRGGYTGTVFVLSYFGFFIWALSILFYLASVAALNRSHDSRQLLLICLVCGFGIYIGFNIVGHLAGLRGPVSIDDAGPNKILSLIGIPALRVAFPFAGGLNNFGSMAGLTIVSGFFLSIYSRGAIRYLLGPTVAVFGLVGAVLVDSRAALALALVCCGALPIVFASQRLSRGIKLLPVVGFLAPFMIILVFALIRDSGLAEYVIRQGAFAQRLGLLSGRDVIWQSALGVLANPHPLQLIGYGALGQFTSGATQGYAWVFSQMGGMSQHSVHNANLQILFDMGYIGLALWLAFWMLLVRDLYGAYRLYGRDIQALIPISIVAFVLLAGVLEICGTPAFADIFVIVMFLVVLTLPTFRGKDAKG